MLIIEVGRSLGMAARFVSGYVHVPDHNDDRNAGGGNTHAWVQVYLPGPGWVDFDPASGIVGNRGLVRVAVVAVPRQAKPLHGTFAQIEFYSCHDPRMAGYNGFWGGLV